MPHISEYLKAVEKALSAGNATEHTHRPALKSFIESLRDGVTATNEPKHIKCGAPDFIVSHDQTPLGYVETKDVGVSLDKAEASEQVQRYRDSLDNLVLTDYLEFRWYVRGEHVQTARLGTFDAQRDRLRVEPGGAEEVGQLLENFLTEVVPTVSSPKELAERMARVARLIRDTILRAFRTEGASGSLHEQLKGFRAVLLHDLDEEQFADMYAQTICYGLFAAKCNARGGEPFTRRHAAHDLPRTNPFLRKLFQHVAGPDLDDEPHAWAVDGLAELLNHTNIGAILKDFGRATRREDPVVHFYETFLAAYDPKMREARGVYYTPEPVVSYIVRSVDHILKTDFKLAGGLADAGKVRVRDAKGKVKDEVHKVLILDPATGTGTFLFGVINHIFESYRGPNRGMWSSYVSQNLLPRVFGFELLMAPYAVAHMKLGLQLAATGYEFNTDERLRVYLTNTLEEAHEYANLPLFAKEIAEEANEASKIKQELPIMVVLGNPPYSGHSANTGLWIANLLRGRDTQTNTKTGNYFEVDGKPLGERNPKYLNDDYVKFIRFAQWRIEQTGYGVLAFITNHGYLDNPTFRGMRQSLMETFDDIYVLDLHGNSKKKERAPDGSKDENVFDIQQGVAIGIFVKRAGTKNAGGPVRHAHLWGLREVYGDNASGERVLTGGKYRWLWQHDVSTTKWTKLESRSPFYLFIPQEASSRAEYEEGWKITESFGFTGEGFKSHRDSFAVAFAKEEANKRLEDLVATDKANDTVSRTYGLKNTNTWKLSEARALLRKEGVGHKVIVSCLYRPFDKRICLLHPAIMDRPRLQTQSHMMKSNVALATTRSVEIHRGFEHVFCTADVMDHHAVSLKEANYMFPLYFYPDGTKDNLFDFAEAANAPGGRRPNLAPEFVKDFAARLKLKFAADGRGDLKKTFGPEDVFHYMYAVFHSPTYRSRYAEFLKIDFPRLPLTSDAGLFRALCRLGDELTGLHLLERDAPPVASYPRDGSHEVEQVRYTAPGEGGSDAGRVWINREQYFEGVPPEVWDFHVGGYQVCQKWLKDRKGRKLTFDDLAHYQRVVAALAETIRLMSEVDATIDGHGGWPLK